MKTLTPFLITITLTTLLAIGCQQKEQEFAASPELDTVELGADPTAGLSTEGDTQARSKPQVEEQGLSGILPSSYPDDLPYFTPADLVDYGTGLPKGQESEEAQDSEDRAEKEPVARRKESKDPQRFVVFNASRPAPRVMTWIGREWRAAGWTLAGKDEWTKAERTAIITAENLGGGRSRVVVRY